MEASQKANDESSLFEFVSEKNKILNISSSFSSVFSKNNNNNNNKKDDDHARKNKSQSGFGSVRPFRFRNLLTCGTADTNESVLVRRNNNNSTNESVLVTHNNKSSTNSLQICKTEVLGGSGTCWSNRQNPRKSYDGTKKQRQNQSDDMKKPVYRAMHGPTCSQCGKPFKPEKLHRHMKSCRGLKAMAKNGAHTHQFMNRN